MNKKVKERAKELITNLSKDKRTLVIILSGLLGIILIAFSGTETKDTEQTASSTETNIYSFTQRHKSELESLLSQIDGVGKVSVMITYESSAETVYGKDETFSKDSESEKSENEYIILDYGSAENGLILKEIYPKVQGVAVVCQGGDEPTIKNEITSMLMALFDINSKSISIASMER